MDENVDIIELSKVDPRNAINKLAWPFLISTILVCLNTFIDGIWISGLSADALAALGFASPLYYLVAAMGIGYGAGINSVMSRFISLDKPGDANNTVLHTLILAVLTHFIFFFIGLFFLDEIIILVGGGSVLALCRQYLQPVFLLAIILMVVDVNSGLYMARGDLKRASNPYIVMAIANIVLDPILIYTLNLGISGAAYATICSSICALIYMNIGQDFRKDILFKTKKRGYRPELRLFKEILVISIPVSLSDIVFSVFSVIVNYLIIFTAGAGEIASFVIANKFAGWVFVPANAIGSAVITVSGATYVSKLWDKFNECINYASMLPLVISIVIALMFFIFRYQFCGIFSIELNDSNVINRAAEILLIYAFYNVLTPLGEVASKAFEGIGSGLKSFILTVLRENILTLVFAYVFAFILNMGVFGVYLGLVVGLSLGSVISFMIIKIHAKKFNECENTA